MGEDTDRRCQGMTEYVGVREVMRLLRCEETYAYDVLRELAGRLPGERGLLRVPKLELERYLLRKFRQTTSTRTRVEPPPGLGLRGGPGGPVAAVATGPRRPREPVYVSPLIPEVKVKRRS